MYVTFFYFYRVICDQMSLSILELSENLISKLCGKFTARNLKEKWKYWRHFVWIFFYFNTFSSFFKNNGNKEKDWNNRWHFSSQTEVVSDFLLLKQFDVSIFGESTVFTFLPLENVCQLCSSNLCLAVPCLQNKCRAAVASEVHNTEWSVEKVSVWFG